MASTTFTPGLRSLLLFCLILIWLGACRNGDEAVSPVSGPSIRLVTVNGGAVSSSMTQVVSFNPNDTTRLRFTKSGSGLRFTVVRPGQAASLSNATSNADTTIVYLPRQPDGPQDGSTFRYRVTDQSGRTDSVVVTFRQLTDAVTLQIAAINGRLRNLPKNLALEYADGDTIKLIIIKRGFNLRYAVKGLSSTFFGAEQSTRDGDTTFNLITSGISSGSTWKLRLRNAVGVADSVIVTLSKTMSRYQVITLTAPLVDQTSKTFITLSTGATWTIIQASNSPGAVDLGFAVGNTVGGVLISPDNWFVSNNEPYAPEIAAWPNRKATQIWVSGGAKISDYLTNTDLASAFNSGTAGTSTNTSYVLSGAVNAGISSRVNSRVGNLTRGSTLVFKTAEGKHGIMVINSVTVGTGRIGQVEVSYKIQL